MFERNIPNWEGFEFCISCFYSTLVIVIQLRKAGCHLSASGSGGSNYDKRTSGFYIIIHSKSVIADDKRNVIWVSGNSIVLVHLYTERFKLLVKDIDRRLMVIACHNNAADVETKSAKSVDKAQNIEIIGDSKVTPDLILLYIICIYSYYNFSLVFQLSEHTNLAVGRKSRQYPCSMKIIKKFAAKFKIQFATKLVYPLEDFFRLHTEIFVVVKTYSLHKNSPKTQTKKLSEMKFL